MVEGPAELLPTANERRHRPPEEVPMNERVPSKPRPTAASPRAVSAAILAAAALAGCAVDAGGDGEGDVGTAVGAVQTVNVGPNMSCSAAVEQELTDFVVKAKQNLTNIPTAGIAGYAIFASRRSNGVYSPLCAVATAGGKARTQHDGDVDMEITTTSAVGSVAKTVTAAYVLDSLVGTPVWVHDP